LIRLNQIADLESQLEALKSAPTEASDRVLVLENLLEDANRRKSQLENDYVREHQKVLLLEKEVTSLRDFQMEINDKAR